MALAPSQTWAQITDTAATEQPAPEWPASEAQVSYETLFSALNDVDTQLAALEGADISEVRVIKVEDEVGNLDETQSSEISSLAGAASPINDNEALTVILTDQAVQIEENTDIVGVALQDGSLFVVTRAGQ